MDFEAIKRAAQGYLPQMTKFLRDLIAIPSESCEEEGVIRRTIAEMEALGFDKAEIDPEGNALGWMGEGSRIIAFDGHIDTVGIGNNNAYMLQEGFFGKQFVRYPGEFDEKLLQQMAAVTGGKYFRAADENGMAEVMQEINKLEKTSFEQPRYVEYREFAPALAAIALVMLMLACCLENSFELTAP